MEKEMEKESWSVPLGSKVINLLYNNQIALLCSGPVYTHSSWVTDSKLGGALFWVCLENSFEKGNTKAMASYIEDFSGEK